MDWYDVEKDEMTESLSVHRRRQEENHTEKRLIEWLRTRNCLGVTQLDEILDSVLCMHQGLDNYQRLDYPSKLKADKLLAQEEVVVITVETLIQWLATPVGYCVLKEMLKEIESAFPEENRRRHKVWDIPQKKEKQPFIVVRDLGRLVW